MAESVKVLVRCRPINARESKLKCQVVVNMDSSVMQVNITNPSDPHAPAKTFTFDAVYYILSSTESIYKDMAYPLVEGVLEGYNGTIFAYGQTGCGKSFTMQGVEDPAEQLGLIPRAFEHIFDVISTAERTKYLVHCSFLEIYNEEIHDLLATDAKRKLELKEHPEKGVYISDLTKNPCHGPEDCNKLMEKGWRNRAVGETLMNRDSSRSHSIFTILIEMISPTEEGQRNQIRAGKLNLVDLAGSERQAKTGATGERLREATKINLSLSALGNVISSLVDAKCRHIPYRDSKLTRLLQDSLGGNTKTMMVACISPADNNYDETLSTLRYANRAKQIRNKPRINEDPKDTLLREYQDEIKRLKSQLNVSHVPHPEILLKTEMDTEQLEEEKERLKMQFDQEINKLRRELEVQKQKTNASGLSEEKMEKEIDKIRKEFEQREQQIKEHYERQKVNRGTATPLPTDIETSVYEKLQHLQQQMVGGELAHNPQALQKRRMADEEVRRRRREIAAAHSKMAAHVVDEEQLLVNAYDDVQATLKARTELAKKMKVRLRAQEQEIDDIQREFAVERGDYLDTMRRQEQQLRLLQQIMERVLPTVRKDCNYTDFENIRRQAVWEETEQRWRIPELQFVKTKLPPAGVNNFLSGSCSADNTSPPSTAAESRQEVTTTTTPASQTAPARLAPSCDHEEDNFLKKLERRAAEDVAGQYFKPTGHRQAELLSSSIKGAADRCIRRPSEELSPSSSNSNSPSASQLSLDTTAGTWCVSKRWIGSFRESNFQLHPNSERKMGAYPPLPLARKLTRLAPVQDEQKSLNTMDLI